MTTTSWNFLTGIVLTGTEAKTLRDGRASIVDGYGSIDGGEVWLENVHIPEYFQGTWTNHASKRKRKLLLHRLEIGGLRVKVREAGLQLVPLSLYFKEGRAKVQIALARGKRTMTSVILLEWRRMNWKYPEPYHRGLSAFFLT